MMDVKIPSNAALLLLANAPVSVRLCAILIATSLIYAIVRSIQQWAHERRLLPTPPGPTGLPLVGNLLDVLKAAKVGEQHLLFEKWARQYGELYKVKVGPFTQYMVNSDIAVKAIFESKHAAQSANRPRWIVSNEHICGGWNVLLIDADTPRWKHQRQVTARNVGSVPRADAGLPPLHYESLKFMYEVAQDSAVQTDSKALWNGVMRYTYSAFTTQMFGLDIPKSDNPAIQYIHETGTAQILGTLPGSYMVDVFPILEQLPTALKPWAQAGSARWKRDVEWCRTRMNLVRNMSDRTSIQDSLMVKILEDEKHLGFPTVEEGAYFCLMLTIGAADTSQISTWAFLEAMITYPGVQEKAYREIEAFTKDRIPSFEDYDSIPYVRCLVKETWRWRPPVGLGHPHVTTEDIVYNNMRIPRGSRLHLNGWAIQHDPARHGDPDEFDPERYLQDATNAMQSINSPNVRDRDHFAFGAGRRICPGYNVAERSLAIAIMQFLWAFEIKASPSAEYPLNNLKWRGTFPGLPGPDMPVMVIPRSQKKMALISKAFAEAERDRVPMVRLHCAILYACFVLTMGSVLWHRNFPKKMDPMKSGPRVQQSQYT